MTSTGRLLRYTLPPIALSVTGMIIHDTNSECSSSTCLPSSVKGCPCTVRDFGVVDKDASSSDASVHVMQERERGHRLGVFTRWEVTKDGSAGGGKEDPVQIVYHTFKSA